MTDALLSVVIAREHDVVLARQRARQVAGALGFDVTEQTRIATAVSEIARNAYAYAGGGRANFGIEGKLAPQVLSVNIVDKGPGIARLQDVLAGDYRSETGMGLGIIGARRLMDYFAVDSGPAGTTVTLKKLLPARRPALTGSDLTRLQELLLGERPDGLVGEVQRQNQELLRALDDLSSRQEELVRLNRELEDTNRGVVALYAELDERADHLRRADEIKTRFLSNMTHEFRTPVNSILALTNLLAERLGTNPEDKDELYFISKSAQQLSDLVDDLLDLAKVEAGKIEVRPASFEVGALFGALRGMLRPLLVNQSLTLVFDEPEGIPPIYSDESKLSQILRNFISNALKYTERGEVRVSVRLTPARDQVEFSVADTGIGIPEKDLPRIFDEFVQIENPLQRRVKGTGLGLPLSKRLAELLGGRISVVSTHGHGSTFRVIVPLIFRDPLAETAGPLTVDTTRLQVLVVEDSDEDLFVVQRALAGTRYQVLHARTASVAEAIVSSVKLAAIVLDIRLHGSEAWDLLARFKRDPAQSSRPVIVVSTVDDQRKGFALGADAYCVKPIDPVGFVRTLDRLVVARESVRVLTVDDEEASRFIIRQLLNDQDHELIEASSGLDGLAKAHASPPDVILLDLRLTDMTGFDVFARLRQDPATAGVPVVVVTSQRLSADDKERLATAQAVLSKSALTRNLLRSTIASAVTAERRL
jgi:signal transduction histidine kinase/DNA-binding response OmpR family regulator